MAGSGPGVTGGWISGSGTYSKDQQRRDVLLRQHEDWDITWNFSTDHFDAVQTIDGVENFMTARSLEVLMDRLEALHDAES